MIFDYLFITRRFAAFAEQAEWVSEILHDQNYRHHRYDMTPIIDDCIKKYMKCREDMAYKMLSFERQSRSFAGWLKSFLPGTIAFKSRSAIANQLVEAKDWYLTISINYYQNMQKLKRRVPPPKKDMTNPNELKKEVHRPVLQQQISIKIRQVEKTQPVFSMWKKV